ncbi:MAG TPA: hypothetical protein DEB17_04900 [Chlorobaculum sp.]|uniref:Uncharacterized protein n=1 Tax=Chlorobaculum tepidum (strain ATCC 49652 / DSM 12025 / NBRC 103806 / TLS) TaxID=194439 RepID=Q8KB07_CHLTE|nr:hypothetical protein CT1991 [Chlorobaculum tepidum TLS]HBU23323.1 hypothetical protein [Chlorobaculum sp.]
MDCDYSFRLPVLMNTGRKNDDDTPHEHPFFRSSSV